MAYYYVCVINLHHETKTMSILNRAPDRCARADLIRQIDD